MDRPGRLWQKWMIRMALSPGVKRAVQACPAIRPLAARFVAGRTPEEAVLKAGQLAGQNLSTSFFFLGEYLTDLSRVGGTVDELGRVISLAGQAGLDLHTSIDPTQAGLMQSRELCRQNLETLARQIRDQGRGRTADVLMVDMEDSGVTQDTLEIFFALRQQGLPVAITLQACLKRTPQDLARASGAMIRLVKGAFAEGPGIAHSPGKQTDTAFFALAGTLLTPGTLAAGTCPVFATHDHRMIEAILTLARRRRIPPSAFEFEMLYGVRPALQRELAARGYRVRVYMPFGKDFWPYSVRRIGENPKNLRFLLRSLGPAKDRVSRARC
jgi:proline dehydrogenase